MPRQFLALERDVLVLSVAIGLFDVGLFVAFGNGFEAAVAA